MFAPSLLIVVLTLLLTACGSSSRAMAAEAAQPTAFLPGTDSTATINAPEIPTPTFTQQANPTATIVSEGSSPVTPTFSVAVPNYPPDTCPVTQPPDPPFIPSSLFPLDWPYEDNFWYGTENFWTRLRADGIWRALPYHHDYYSQKVWWWRQGYYWLDEPRPELTVTGQRLDAEAPPLQASSATNDYPDFEFNMLVGVGIPTLGCWEITGRYGAYELSFVVWVAP